MKIDVIKLAKEAGYGEVMAALHGPALERFAALVIEECAITIENCEPDEHGRLSIQEIAEAVSAMKEQP